MIEANCFEECNVLTTESVNSAPFHMGETKVQIFGKGKCNTLRQFSVLARKSANFFAKRQLAKLLSGNEVRGKVAIAAMLLVCRRLSISLVRYRHGLEKFLEHHFIPIRRRF